VSLIGVPPGAFPLPIFSIVLNAIAARGLIARTRRDLQEAVDIAAEGKMRAHVHRHRLENINSVFGDLKGGTVTGRVVLTLDWSFRKATYNDACPSGRRHACSPQTS
jgi:propanol-preferring alcohol dehydrogenase